MNIGAWVLLVFVHVGPLGDGNSNALTAAYFETPTACKKAGEAFEKVARGTVKSIEFVCMPAK